MTNTLFQALFAPLTGRSQPLLILRDGQRLGGDAFLAMVGRMSQALMAAGLQPGDRLAVQVAKSPEALALYGAAVAAGVVFLPLNPGYTAGEVRYFLQDSGARLLICDPARVADLMPLAQDCGATLFTMDASGRGTWAAAMAVQPAAVAPVARGPQDLAAILYTSGTTGRAKGAMLTHANLLSNAQVLAAAWHFGPQDVLLHALPIFHTHGLFVASNIALLTGAAMIFLPGFQPDDVFGALPGATVMMGVPTFYTRLLDDPRLSRASVAHMRLFVSGSAPLLAETHAQFAERTGHRVLERYGMTETNMNTSNPYDGARKAGTVGLPLPGTEVRIAGADGAPLPAGETGMIEVRGPNVFAGYWQMPEKTAQDMRPDGFFITGDLGRFDADGYLEIVGRQKDVIISGGYNIYPKEVELALDALPGVRESAVIGVPHPDLGEAVVAVLVPLPGADLALDAILSGLSGQLARFKQPRAVVLVADLPRNAMGKVQKNLLRQTSGGLFQV